MRVAIERHAFALVPAGTITVSSGIAVFPTDGGDVAGVIQAADRSLYQAKREGRNRVHNGEARAA